MIGNHLSHYLIEAELGRGGMGIVYRAKDTKLDRTVAIKVLPSAALSSDQGARFYREAKAAAALTHPNIAVVHAVDEAIPEGAPFGTEPSPFIAMEFIAGQTLEDRIKEGPLKLIEAVKIASAVASGLDAAHKKDIVHRDIKSSNIMLDERGIAKILDFGLAQTDASTKLTQMGSTLGTVAYMSPEQTRGEPVDRRTDIWSLGTVLYEMIAGRAPFLGDYQQALVYSILNEDPEPLTALRTGVPLELERITAKCLAKEADRRYQNADDLIADLKGVDLTTVSRTTSHHSGALRSTDVFSRRYSLKDAIILMGCVLGAVVATWLLKDTVDSTESVSIAMIKKVSIEPVQEWYPSLHPAGDRVVYMRGDSAYVHIYYRSAAGGTPRKLVEQSMGFEYYPSYSPDGTRVLFESEGTIYQVDAVGGIPDPIATTETDFYAFPTWSPSGDRIAYTTESESVEIRTLGASESEQSIPVREPHGLSWSPDGRYIAVCSGNQIHAFGLYNDAPSSIWLIDTNNWSVHPIIADDFTNLSPRWSPDASSLYFVSDRLGGSDIYVQKLTDSGEADGGSIRLTAGMSLHSISVSGDGGQIVAGSSITSLNVWAVPVGPDKVRTLADATPVTNGNQIIEGFALSRDETRIAYDSNVKGGRHTFFQPLRGGSPSQLTNSITGDYVNDWSPTSNEIAYHTYPGGIRTPQIVKIADRSVESISNRPVNERNPIWLWDDDTMAFSREVPDEGRYQIVMVTRDQEGRWGNERVIAEDHAFGSAVWEDAKKMLLYIMREENVIYAWDPASDTHRKLMDFNDWYSDGRNVQLIQSNDRGSIYLLNYDSNGEAVLSADPSDNRDLTPLVTLPAVRMGNNMPTVGRDRFYFTLRETDNDIWLMDLDRE